MNTSIATLFFVLAISATTFLFSLVSDFFFYISSFLALVLNFLFFKTRDNLEYNMDLDLSYYQKCYQTKK